MKLAFVCILLLAACDRIATQFFDPALFNYVGTTPPPATTRLNTTFPTGPSRFNGTTIITGPIATISQSPVIIQPSSLSTGPPLTGPTIVATPANPTPPIATIATIPGPTAAPPAPPVNQAGDGNNGNPTQCYVRTCDQFISARNISYERALEIMQSEEYLEEADIIVRRSGRWKRQLFDFATSTSFTNPLQYWNNTASEPWCIIGGLLIFTFAALSLSQPQVPQLPQPQPQIQVQNNQNIQDQDPEVEPPEGQAPASSPQPGTPGGGGLPVITSAISAEALSLVPPGLVPVSIFPPFVSPRTFDAVGVIFSESDETSVAAAAAANGVLRRYARSTLSQTLAHWGDRMMKALFPSNRREAHAYDYQHPAYNSYYRPRQVVPRLYGLRVRVRLVEELCTLGVTCDANGMRCDGSSPSCPVQGPREVLLGRLKRQTGQVLQSDAAPDCRTEFIRGCQESA